MKRQSEREREKQRKGKRDREHESCEKKKLSRLRSTNHSLYLYGMITRISVYECVNTQLYQHAIFIRRHSTICHLLHSPHCICICCCVYAFRRYNLHIQHIAFAQCVSDTGAHTRAHSEHYDAENVLTKQMTANDDYVTVARRTHAHSVICYWALQANSKLAFAQILREQSVVNK